MKDKQAVARPVSLGSSAVGAILSLPRETKRLIMASSRRGRDPDRALGCAGAEVRPPRPVARPHPGLFPGRGGFGAVLLLGVGLVPGRDSLHGPEGHDDRDRRASACRCWCWLAFDRFVLPATRSRCRRSASTGRWRCRTSAAAASSRATCSCAARSQRAGRRRASPSTAPVMPARVSARSFSAGRTSSRSPSSTTRNRCRAAASTASACTAPRSCPTWCATSASTASCWRSRRRRGGGGARS